MDYDSQYLKEIDATGKLLRYKNKALESEYWDYKYSSKKGFAQITLVITAIALVSTAGILLPHISQVAGEDKLDTDFLIRLVLGGFVLSGLVAVSLGAKYYIVQSLLLLSAILCGLSFSSLMWFSNYDTMIYYNYSFIHLLFYLYILLLIPIWLTIPTAIILTMYHLFSGLTALGNLSFQEIAFLLSPTITLLFIITYAGYEMEKSDRFNFVYRKALGKEYEAKIEDQEQRSNWLRLYTDFLRHELKNSLIGVSSSIQLIDRKNKNSELSNYINRAGNSAEFMKRLLNEASSATSLEAALNEVAFEELNLSALLSSKIEEYSEIYSENLFDVRLDKDITGRFDSDRIVQALDKLVNNAIEHSPPNGTVKIRLHRFRDLAKIEIINIGDTIKGDIDIFQPFVSEKPGKSDENFGLGLFVVKRIVESHRGKVHAESLQNPDGAKFTVTLPL